MLQRSNTEKQLESNVMNNITIIEFIITKTLGLFKPSYKLMIINKHKSIRILIMKNLQYTNKVFEIW